MVQIATILLVSLLSSSPIECDWVMQPYHQYATERRPRGYSFVTEPVNERYGAHYQGSESSKSKSSSAGGEGEGAKHGTSDDKGYGAILSQKLEGKGVGPVHIRAKNFLRLMEEMCSVEYNKDALAQWNYESNISEETRQQAIAASLRLAKFQKFIWKYAKQFKLSDLKDPDLRRQLSSLQVLGDAALPKRKLKMLHELQNEMQTIYSTAHICAYKKKNNCSVALEPDITDILTYSRDPEELKYVWEAWRNATGRKMRTKYQKYVALTNEVARLNNYSDTVKYWIAPYGDDNFEETVEKLWAKVKPLYKLLHAHVRRKLRERYGEERVPLKGPIPAHLLGNMWGHSWNNVYNFSLPYPKFRFPDVTAQMRKEGYTPIKMFKEAEQFFLSLNLSPMPPTFWERSIFEKPSKDIEMVCHASAWDMFDGKDFRIKMCAKVSLEDYVVVHHEMGHVQYFIQYKDQPTVYREGANPGFHEAIGDVMALSVSTSDHLRQLNLLSRKHYGGREYEMNLLYNMALQKLAFVPYGLLVDRWRWDVLRRKTTMRDYNSRWWELRHKYEGLMPPSPRSEMDFDPGAKYHIAAGVPYIRYFVSYIVQFQFHKALCEVAGRLKNNRPLHQCDIYGSKEAGSLLGKMLSMGCSRPWPEAMEMVTGQRDLDVGPLLEYFAPLEEWLKQENELHGEYIGWDGGGPTTRRRRNGCSRRSEVRRERTSSKRILVTDKRDADRIKCRPIIVP